jgi:hypothetical protein
VKGMARGKPKAPKPAAKQKTKRRTGLPAESSITGVDDFRTGNKVLRVIHTNERDAYDPDPPATTLPPEK